MDEARLIQNNSLNYGYLDEWCAARGGRLSLDTEGCHRISISGPPGKRPCFFWLPRLNARSAGEPLRAIWRQDTFAGQDAYIPGMLAVLLKAAASAGRGVEIIFSLGDKISGRLDRQGMYYFLLPTDFQLALAHKGEYEIMVALPGAAGGHFGSQGAYEGENSFIRGLEDALAPSHPIYPVGPEAPEMIRPYFLLGHRQAVLKSLVRDGEGLKLIYRLNSLPGDREEDIAEHFKTALARVGRPDACLEAHMIHAGGRSAATQEDLADLYHAFTMLSGLQPDVDWFMCPSPAGLLCSQGYKTAAFGPGRYRDYLAGAPFDRAEGKKLSLILQGLLEE